MNQSRVQNKLKNEAKRERKILGIIVSKSGAHVWVYTNTDSLLLSVLMHASSTGFFGTLISTTMTPVNWIIYYNVYGVILCLVALVIAIKFGKTLGDNSPKSLRQEI